MLKQLRRNFVIVIMVIVTVLFATVFGFVLHQTKQNLERESIQMMRAVTSRPHDMMPGHRPDEKPSGKPENKPEGKPDWKPEVGESRIRLLYFTVRLSAENEILETSGNDSNFTDETLLQSLTDLALEDSAQTGVLSKYDLRFIKEDRGSERMIIFADISGEKAMLRGLIRNLLLAGAIGYAAFFVISLLLAKWVAKPVEKTWNEQKQFIADASHELKTPLTVIMTNAEMLADRNYSEEDRDGFTANILSMSKRMRGLVESLLELARMDNRQTAAHFDTLDFSKLVNDSILPFEPLFYENETELKTEIEPNIRIEGDKEKLRQVMAILLDNALKYDDPAYPVEITLRRQAGHALLSFSGRGEPLSKEDCKNIFKRFYRVDQVRNDGRSYGLGLSIAESIAAEHNGRIWAESSGGCNTFFLSFSLAPKKNFGEA